VRLDFTASRSATPTDLRVQRLVDRWLPLCAAATLTTYAFCVLWFIDREPSFDEQALYNPIRQFLDTGHMRYPIYPTTNSENGMFVHPPTHYLIVAVTMWITRLPVEAAAILPVVAILAVGAFAVATARFSIAAKFAFFVGLASIVIWSDPFLIRPDVAVAAAWLAGLVTIESGRVSGWSVWRLGVGAGLLALASALHYPASPTVIGVAVYVVWAIRELGWCQARSRVAVLAGGGVLVLAPYALLFVIPFIHDIVRFSQLESPGVHGILGPFMHHRSVYHQIYDTEVAFYRNAFGSSPGGALLHWLSAPFTRWGIPLPFVTTAVFFARRETRGLALASIPYLFFLLFVARWTGPPGFRGYFIEEFTLFFASAAYVWALAAIWAAKRITPQHSPAAAATAGASAFVTLLLLAHPTIDGYGTRTAHPRHDDMEVARAATGTLLPPNASLASTQANLFFTSGARTWHPMWRDVLKEPDLSRLNVDAYLRGFTGVAESELATWESYNKQRQNVSTWLIDGRLHLWRFYFGARRAGRSLTEIRYVLLSPTKRPLEGSAYDGTHVYRFTPQASGEWTFAAYECPVLARAISTLKMPWQAPVWVPGKDNSDPYAAAARGEKRFVIRSWVERTADFASRHRVAFDRECKRVLVERLNATLESPDAVVRKWDRRRDPNRVDVPAFVPAVNALYTPRTHVRVDNKAFDLSRIVTNGATVKREGTAMIVRTPSVRYGYAFQLPLAAPDRSEWVRLDGRVTHGSIGICILAPRRGCAVQRTLPEGADGPFYLPIPRNVARPAFYVDNQSGDASEMRISRIRVVESARKRVPAGN
jgi:hypothetical protein